MPPFAASLFDAVVIKSAEALNYVRGLNTVGAAYIQQPPTCGFDNIGALLPDARSIVVTQRRKEVTHEWATREWDMCKDNHSCKHEEAQGHIVFGFPADSLVVEFTGPQGYDHVSYSDIDILVERPGPETIPSPHFTLRGGVCHQYQSGFRCGIPFKAIGPDRLGGMCTSAGHGLSTFDVKIEAVASIGSKEFRFFGRSSTGSFGWFSLSYTCTK
jgi:hypothetical protein